MTRVPMHLDVTSEQNWVQVVDAVMAAHGRLDILFNNAGVSFPGKVEDISDRELGVHAKGFSWSPARRSRPCAKAAAGRSSMRPRSWALSAVPPRDLVGRQGRHHDFYQVGGVAICKGKYPHQLGASGYTDTPLTERRFNDPAGRQMLPDRTPMGRLGTAEDIANGVRQGRARFGEPVQIDGSPHD